MDEAINSETQRIINEFRNRIGGKAARHQYAPAKHQITSLTKLGLLDYMPRGFGNGDADAVLRAALDAPKQVGGMVEGEGDVTTTDGSDLWKLLNPPAPDPEPVASTSEPGYTEEEAKARRALNDLLQKQLDELYALAATVPFKPFDPAIIEVHRIIRRMGETIVEAKRPLVYGGSREVRLIDDYVKD